MQLPDENRLVSPLDLARQQFAAAYGTGEQRIWRAPARINILGEHVDYVSYLPTASLPFGSHEHAMFMVYRANESGLVRAASVNKSFPPFQFALTDGLPALQYDDWADYLHNHPTPEPHWSNYVKGAVFYALHKARLNTARGFDFIIGSSIPPQGGSSSSSALVVLSGAAFRQTNDLPFTPSELAKDSAAAEWYVGTRGGALDQTAICLARRHHVVHLRYASQAADLLPLPDAGYRWVTFFTHAADKGRSVMVEYNERAAVARIIIPALLESRFPHEWQRTRAGNVQEQIPSLLPEEIILEEFQQQAPAVFAQCQNTFPRLVQERSTKPLKIRDRARHHVGEVARVEEAVKFLHAANDPHTTMQALGTLLNGSHASLRDWYDVSTPSVDSLYNLLQSDPQVLGARLIGGGFGGNVLALTNQEHVAPLLERIQQNYYAPQQRDGLGEGAILVSTSGDGLSQME